MRRRRQEKQTIWSKKNIIALFIVLIMITSVMGFIFSGDQTVTRYNGFKIKEITKPSLGSYYVIKIDGTDQIFQYHPQNLEQITIDNEAVTRLKDSSMFVVTYNESQKYVEEVAVLQLELSEHFAARNKYIQNALIHANTYNTPVMDCINATPHVPVLRYQEGNESSIRLVDNCIIISGRYQQDYRAATEALLYKIFGVLA